MTEEEIDFDGLMQCARHNVNRVCEGVTRPFSDLDFDIQLFMTKLELELAIKHNSALQDFANVLAMLEYIAARVPVQHRGQRN